MITKYKTKKYLRKTSGYISIFSSSLKPIIILLALIFVWLRYNDLVLFLKTIFKKKPDFYKGEVKDLPEDKEYYIQFAKNVADSINGISPLNLFLYQILDLEDEELKYVVDIYHNPEHPLEGMVEGIKNDAFNKPALWVLLTAKFSKAGISF